MKVVTAAEMVRVEKYAYEKGASEEAFMERAGQGVAELVQRVVARYHLLPKILLLCGGGNNGGDAYVAGRLLQEGGFTVIALAAVSYADSRPMCQLQSKRFSDQGGRIIYVQEGDAMLWSDAALLVDGLLGTGFHGSVTGVMRTIIETANASGLPIVSIDVPSGIDASTGAVTGSAIYATETLFLGLPKSGCCRGEAWNHVGKPHVYPFGLSDEAIERAHADYIWIEERMIHGSSPRIRRNRHKYQAGYVAGWGGSPGMPGAPTLASLAALRSGAGIVRLFHPTGMEGELSSAPYEIIRQGYDLSSLSSQEKMLEPAGALFIGPGLGLSPAAGEVVKYLLARWDKPVVIDADALYHIAVQQLPIPKQAILTPHQGEMKKLLQVEKLSESEILEKSHAFAQKHQCIVVLKGAPTFIFPPTGTPYLSSRGDPGMATAGSGDVLTGIVASFCAQLRDPLQAAIVGVYLHSVAGEEAAREKTSPGMIASDLIASLPAALRVCQLDR